jgi:SAM-dependent methyltransferase
MLAPEARWFARQLARFRNEALSPLVNLGSQSLAFRTQVQPWIDRFVFAPLRQRQIQVVHSDLQAADGVELVGDLADPAFLAQLKTMQFRAVICSNLLEHLVNPGLIAETIVDILEPGGLLFASVPYRFPYHADPIDTMYRPSPAELADLFPRTAILEQTILGGGNLTTYVLGRLFGCPGRFLRDVVGKKTIDARQASGDKSEGSGSTSQKPGFWGMLPWMVRRFQVSCVVLRKDQE